MQQQQRLHLQQQQQQRQHLLQAGAEPKVRFGIAQIGLFSFSLRAICSLRKNSFIAFRPPLPSSSFGGPVLAVWQLSLAACLATARATIKSKKKKNNLSSAKVAILTVPSSSKPPAKIPHPSISAKRLFFFFLFHWHLGQNYFGGPDCTEYFPAFFSSFKNKCDIFLLFYAFV